MAIIVLDPGHGGSAKVGGSSPNNAISKPRGILEKTLTLDVARRAKALLQASGHAVYLTRNGDTNLGLADRAAVARTRKADVFLSIHFNGWPTPDVQGSEAFSHPDAPSRSARLARAVLDKVVVATGYKDRGAKQEKYGVLNPASHLALTAASLVELSFISVPAEDARLTDPAYLDRLADAAARGIEAYLAAEFPRAAGPALEDGFKARTGAAAPV